MKKIMIVLIIVAGFVTVTLPAISANALNGGDFNPGRIIDDSVFFNPNTISPNEVQLFLNSKVANGTCDTAGAQPYSGTTRAAYGTSRGYPPPYICLKDYSQNTSTRPAETGLCNIYNGGVKSAAAIIYDIGQACGINPKVLLVLLEKEQSLLSDDWPWPVQYGSATGFGCPDTAPCDPQFGAFFDQVYYAARQFKKYERDSTLYRYRPNRDNYIQYHPNAACGGTNVFIQNQSTAGLYNYTPYQPNPSALANLYGVGDNCGAYGNRNFWRLFNDWFGSVNGSAYSWQLVSQEAFSDPAMTQPLSGTPTLQPGATAYLKIRAKNTGYLPWERTFLNLGTSSPNDRTSQFNHSSWVNYARPTKLQENSVSPSETGTLVFSVTAPTTAGSYREHFNLVADGRTWLNDNRLSYIFNVVNPVLSFPTSSTTLLTSEQILPNKYLLSPDGQSVLTLERNGNLTLYSDFKPIWSSGTAGYSPRNAVMQTDGNLVLYDINNTPLWNSATYGNPGARLVMQPDGNLVIYSATNNVLWTTSTIHNPNYYGYVNTTLHTGKLYPGQQLQTADRKYRLVLQGDGNLVLYSPTRAIWASDTDGRQISFLAMQTDGNLVLYDQNYSPLWYSRTSGLGISALVLQPDANLVLYNGIGQATWATSTVGRQ